MKTKILSNLKKMMAMLLVVAMLVPAAGNFAVFGMDAKITIDDIKSKYPKMLQIGIFYDGDQSDYGNKSNEYVCYRIKENVYAFFSTKTNTIVTDEKLIKDLVKIALIVDTGSFATVFKELVNGYTNSSQASKELAKAIKEHETVKKFVAIGQKSTGAVCATLLTKKTPISATEVSKLILNASMDEVEDFFISSSAIIQAFELALFNEIVEECDDNYKIINSITSNAKLKYTTEGAQIYHDNAALLISNYQILSSMQETVAKNSEMGFWEALFFGLKNVFDGFAGSFIKNLLDDDNVKDIAKNSDDILRLSEMVNEMKNMNTTASYLDAMDSIYSASSIGLGIIREMDDGYLKRNQAVKNYNELISTPYNLSVEFLKNVMKSNSSPTINSSYNTSNNTVGSMTSSSNKSTYTTGENVVITWTKAANATKYGLTIVNNATNERILDSSGFTGTSHTVKNLPAGTYRFNMRGYSSNGSYGPVSDIKYFTVKEKASSSSTSNNIGFSAQSAADYAIKYWKNYNSKYGDYGPYGGDCANFVSQALYAGGIQMTDDWYFNAFGNAYNSVSWRYVPGFVDYFKNTLGCKYISTPSASDINVGDIMVYGDEDHLAICVKVENKKPYVCAHTKDVYTSNWTLDYRNYGVIKTSELDENISSQPIVNTNSDNPNRPSKTEIYNLKESYNENDTVSFNWKKTNNTTHYNIWFDVWKNGEYTYYNQIKEYTSTDYSITLPAGEYRVKVTTYNRNHWEYDHSDWLHCKSDYYEFEVNKSQSSLSTNNNKTDDGWSATKTTTEKPKESDTLRIVKTETEYCYYHYCSPSRNYGVDSIKRISSSAQHSNYHEHETSSKLPKRDDPSQDRGRQQPYGTSSSKCSNGWVYWFPASNFEKTTYHYQTLDKTYEIVYHANGGNGAPSKQTKKHGINITLNSSEPTRTGYTFVEWNTRGSGSGTSYKKGATYTANENVTLYAVWEPLRYGVYYHANNSTIAKLSKTHGVDHILLEDTPERTGYTFVGWNTKADGTGKTYAAGASYSEDKSLDLYAKWTPNTYTISYNANDGTDAPASQTKTHNEKIYIPEKAPKRDGYTFVGWATSKTGSVAYKVNQQFTDNKDTTLFAVWEPNTYTISYNANGGSGAPSNQTKKHAESIKLSTQEPTRNGYTFVEWSDGYTHIQPGEKFHYDGNVEFVAQWKLNTYTISYNANDGTDAPASQTKTHNEKIYIPEKAPKRDGYTFVGWATSKTGSVAYKVNQQFTDNKDTTLFAVWEPNTYTISYNANGGSGAPSNQTKKHTESIKLSTQEPTKEGYIFLGWSTSPGGDVEFAPGSICSINENITLFALWQEEENEVYYIIYNANGGKNSPLMQTKNQDEDVTISKELPEREGYIFKGWAVDNNNVVVYSSGDTYKENKTLYLHAVWVAKTYTISYDAKGGFNVPRNQIKTHDENITISEIEPEKENFKFVGWSDNPDAEYAKYFAEEIFAENTDTVLYAVWEEIIEDEDGDESDERNGENDYSQQEDIPFDDVPKDAWYRKDVENAYTKGLINGKNEKRYAPNDNMTYAEAIKLACTIYQLYYDGEVTLVNGKDTWYSTYMEYALENRIVRTDYSSVANDYVTRKEFVNIFYGALPLKEFVKINNVEDNIIPDVKIGDAYSGEIYTFYRAGILTGNDKKGTFKPDSNIARSEVAAIVTRMLDNGVRKELSF